MSIALLPYCVSAFHSVPSDENRDEGRGRLHAKSEGENKLRSYKMLLSLAPSAIPRLVLFAMRGIKMKREADNERGTNCREIGGGIYSAN